MKPVKLSKSDLIGLLGNMVKGVESDDSFDGSIEYHATEEPQVFEVMSMFRHGNSRGQGFMQVIGDTPEEE